MLAPLGAEEFSATITNDDVDPVTTVIIGPRIHLGDLLAFSRCSHSLAPRPAAGDPWIGRLERGRGPRNGASKRAPIG